MDIESTHENLVLREFNKIPKGLSKENTELFYHILSSHEKPNILKAKNEFLQRKNEFNPRKKIRKQPTRLGPKRRIVLDEQTDGMIQEKKVQNMGTILERKQEDQRKRKQQQEKQERQQQNQIQKRNKRIKLEKKDP